MIRRESILIAIRFAVEPMPVVRSMFEGGSAAFGRLDNLSDIDLGMDVEDGSEGAVFAAVEAALAELAPIEAMWVLPEPTWHGMSQRFYRLAGTSEYLVIDLCLRPRSKAGTLSEVEQHGEPIVYFVKEGCEVASRLDREKLRAVLRARIAMLRDSHPFMANLAEKEARRGHPADAIHFYIGLNLRPLVELLRIRHCPERHAFGLRYIEHDLPPEIARELIDLAYVRDLEDLRAKQARCRAWFEREIASLPTESG